MVEAEEDIDDLLILCKSDITSKNERKVVKYLQNLELVKEKIANVKEKDRLRNWQPPVTGNDIINTFVIDKPQLIGEIKSELRELILSGKVPDEYKPAFETMLELGKQRGLKLKNEKTNAKFPS
jgi:poly(A) polymerase